MTNDDFLLVHKSILPDYYDLVIRARELIEGEGKSVTEVCKQLGISRSTYYKYKDYVFYTSKDSNKKVVLSCYVDDKPGILSQILSRLYSVNINILTIDQQMPIQHKAYITLTVDVDKATEEISAINGSLSQIPGVRKVEVISHE